MPFSTGAFDSVRPAGKKFVGRDESVEYALRDPERAPTPPKAAQFRTVNEPGVRVLHPGFRGDPKREGAVFGRIRDYGADTTNSLLDTAQPPMAELITQKAEERAFLSTKRLPLGKGYVHGGAVARPPAATLAPDFRYGKPSDPFSSAKDAIFQPSAADPEADEAATAVYQKSHRAFPPGVQRKGAVDWAATSVNPEHHTFGRPQAGLERNAVGKCLNPASLENGPGVAAALTAIVPKPVDDWKAHDAHRLGVTRGHPAADFAAHPPVYGKKAQRTEAGEWGVGDCIRGDATWGDQQPDADLGRSLTPGFRNAGFADPARRFGLPSVRTDVAPRATSLATIVDFGEGSSAAALLAPCAYAELGVGEADFTKPQAPGRLRALFERTGTRLSDAEFGALWNHAALHGRHTPVGSVCVQEFREGLNEVLAARDAGEEPEWFSRAMQAAEAGEGEEEGAEAQQRAASAEGAPRGKPGTAGTVRFS